MKVRVLIAAGLLAVATSPLRAATITVTTTADSGLGSLRDALANAGNGDTIDVSGVSGTILLTSSELLVSRSITIVGPGPAKLAVDGNASSRVFHISPGATVSISSLTITNGSAIGSLSGGGGIYNERATLTISNCTLSGNSADFGGGVFSDGAISLENDTGGATLTIVNSTLSGNRAHQQGGGICNGGGIGFGGNATLTVSNSTISDNSAQFGGGGIAAGGFIGSISTLEIVNCTLKGNSAYMGGGIRNEGAYESATVEIANSTITDNSAYIGGGIENDGSYGSGTVEIAISTLNSNSATNGGGIFNATTLFGSSNGIATVKIGNTILNAGVAGANITNASGTITSLGYNLSSDDGGGFLTASGDQINTRPTAWAVAGQRRADVHACIVVRQPGH